ncbi:ABC-type glycerol-3-phosphate transport system, substrate-binding protein [Evansella caseinilytica]|uniref:ABC-type glycerol-3-phosphate transport system, substrate-binding protein n=1 Tax=Evansella caseinilytica TaxID=1503961 RepID=A0A1H3TDS6_9BACI|nr:extracellular solute-binding protein [Evansella caseinilytica]SDZ48250.1 ABC-type glycerol-3-phosphate transport system, substrate-binding protein [Evansella caseinilytica]
MVFINKKRLYLAIAMAFVFVCILYQLLNVKAEEADDAAAEGTEQKQTDDSEQSDDSVYLEQTERTSELFSDNATSVLTEKYSTYISEIDSRTTYDGADIVWSDPEELAVDASFIVQYDGMEVIKLEPKQEVTMRIEAPESGLYNLGLTYLINNDNVLPTQLKMELNGEVPFFELRNLVFESRWKSPDNIPKDKYGNEIVPQPVKVTEWQEKYIGDSSYRTSEPFLIYLEAGENKLSFRVIEGSMLIRSLFLSAPAPELPDFEAAEVKGDGFVHVEGEQIAYRNDSSIRAGALYNVDLTPYSADKRVLNYLDDSAFKKPGHQVEYEFEVAETGFYYLGMHYRQNAKSDFPVFLNIAIDDAIPFRQFNNYPLPYTANFTRTTIREQETDKEIPVYLDAGKHTIRFSISIDHLKPTVETIEQLINDIQSLSLEITNLAGPDADRHRDINIEDYIPGVTEQLLNWADTMNRLYENMKALQPDADEIGAFSSLNIAEKQLRSLAEETNKLIVRKNELSTGTNSITAYLGHLLQDINDNGVAVDAFYFYQNPKDIPEEKGFFSKQYAKLERLVNSFGDQDYAVDSGNPDHLQIWINRPRQYIEIIQQMIDEQFTPETGINVDISLMPDQNKLILANASGDAPDAAIGVNYALPFEIAIRGALQNLTELDGFEEVKSRFPAGLHVPATVEGGIYALPDTMNFWVLFYREDILESLDLPVPETLDEVRTYLPELQRRGMNFFYPTAGMPGLKIFAGTMPIIYQNGGKFYGETIGRTALNDNEAIEGIRQLTELFTIYNIPYDVPSFYQQFRDGSLPIGISDYFMYNLILNAAPEIANSWDIALVPGIENEDGDIERWSAGGAESNIIFKDSDKVEEAWEFLKWWSSTEVQVAFGNTLQTTYGEEYIWNTANIEAYEGLPWNTSHKEVILAQTEWLTEVPRVPGSYLLEREISNAYNSIILDGENVRTAIDLASKRINRETFRKLEEFGYMKDGETIREYPNPEFK